MELSDILSTLIVLALALLAGAILRKGGGSTSC